MGVKAERAKSVVAGLVRTTSSISGRELSRDAFASVAKACPLFTKASLPYPGIH
jgi:hypothetical protein